MRDNTALRLGPMFYTGCEMVDLEDMEYECGEGTDGAESAIWYRGCRCGEKRGYVVTEEMLNAASARITSGTAGENDEVEMGGDGGIGTVVVGCEGCSLWIAVEFGIDVDG